MPPANLTNLRYSLIKLSAILFNTTCYVGSVYHLRLIEKEVCFVDQMGNGEKRFHQSQLGPEKTRWPLVATLAEL